MVSVSRNGILSDFQKDVSRPFRASNSHHIPAPEHLQAAPERFLPSVTLYLR